MTQSKEALLLKRCMEVGWPLSLGTAMYILDPQMRRNSLVGLIHAGQCRSLLHCAGCGAHHSYASAWPKPAHAYTFEAEHNANCEARYIARAIRVRAKVLGEPSSLFDPETW